MRSVEEFSLQIPKLLRKVNLVFLRVDDSSVFGEERGYRLVLSRTNIFERGLVVNKFSVLENRHHKFFEFIVGERRFLPGLFGMENGEGLRCVESFVFEANQVRLRHAVFEDTHDLFNAGIGGLFVAVGHFDFGHEFAVLFKRTQLVHPKEALL